VRGFLTYAWVLLLLLLRYEASSCSLAPFNGTECAHSPTTLSAGDVGSGNLIARGWRLSR
jgi:hypothetical protein